MPTRRISTPWVVQPPDLSLQLLARKVDCSVINAGDGAHEHPTQALLDALTLRQKKGREPTMEELSRAAGHAENLKWAEHHADIIRRFGRFPHRNRLLGRSTTPDEQAFLDEGGFPP